MPRRWPLVVALVALAAAFAVVACGDNDGGSRVDESVGEEVDLEGPPSVYAPALNELLAPATVNPAETYEITPTNYAGGVGEQRAQDWGYRSGHQVQYLADGLVAGAATGNYYTTVQVYLYASVEGAQQAFLYYEEQDESAQDSVPAEVERVGNQSTGAEIAGERTLPGTDIPAEFHRVVFRRGNMIGIVQTFGAAEFMSIVPAREIAAVMDQRAMGERPAVEPTPINRPTSPAT